MSYSLSQKFALDAYERGDSFFLTGKAGTGKSFITREIIRRAKEAERKVIICAPTGIAADNIGGTTIHHTFRAPIRPIKKGERATDPKVKRLLARVDLIIIDEISMCRADLLGYIARSILDATQARNAIRDKQIIFVGDLYQLSPILSSGKPGELRVYMDEYGAARFPFEAPEWKVLGLTTIELQENFRQADNSFLQALDYIREGDPSGFSVLRDREVKEWQADLRAVNICPRKEKVNEINENRLKDLHQPIFTYNGESAGSVKETDKIADEVLRLAVGARVMMLANNPAQHWFNGSMGTVTKCYADSVDILIDGQAAPVCVYNNVWIINEYRYNKKDDKVEIWPIGSYTQIPCKLAYAMTIHKSQGQTFDRVNVYTGFFDYGMMYVALSRCRTLGGLNIIGTLNDKELKCAPQVKDFMDSTSILRTKEPEKPNIPSIPEFLKGLRGVVIPVTSMEQGDLAKEVFKDYPGVMVVLVNSAGGEPTIL